MQGIKDITVPQKLGLDKVFHFIDESFNVMGITKLGRIHIFLELDTCSNVKVGQLHPRQAKDHLRGTPLLTWWLGHPRKDLVIVNVQWLLGIPTAGRDRYARARCLAGITVQRQQLPKEPPAHLHLKWGQSKTFAIPVESHALR